jgi:hypothetical protein
MEDSMYVHDTARTSGPVPWRNWSRAHPARPSAPSRAAAAPAGALSALPALLVIGALLVGPSQPLLWPVLVAAALLLAVWLLVRAGRA